MKCTLVDSAKDKVVYNFTECTKAELENKLNLFFSSEGYKLKTTKDNGWVYEKGNRVMRILFGAFVKYHKFFVGIQQQNDLFSIMVQRDSSGMSGGLIGVSQVRKEFTRLTEAFKTYFTGNV
jgi:hypothetical protein